MKAQLGVLKRASDPMFPLTIALVRYMSRVFISMLNALIADKYLHLLLSGGWCCLPLSVEELSLEIGLHDELAWLSTLLLFDYLRHGSETLLSSHILNACSKALLLSNFMWIFVFISTTSALFVLFHSVPLGCLSLNVYYWLTIILWKPRKCIETKFETNLKFNLTVSRTKAAKKLLASHLSSINN